MASPDPTVDRMLAGVRAAGLKLTPQRMAVVRALAGDTSHPTAQELFERLRPALPTMSFATVYNTLSALREAGLCAALSLVPGSGRFDPNMEAHDHAVCDGCGAVTDVPLGTPARGARRALAAGAPGFEVRAVEQVFRGLCARCAGRQRRGRRAHDSAS
jgi:Fur family peroxide stress response transcriptional regulator